MTTTLRKTAVVTGASSGIGAIYADRLAKRGYDLLLVARREERLKSLAAKLEASYGVTAKFLVADLATEAGQAAVEHMLIEDQSVCMLVNNAGIARLSPISSSPLLDSLSQVAINITALTRLTHAVLPQMKARNEGTIINISSVLGLNALAFSAVYSGTKAFVLAFSSGLQEELVDTNVRVQVVVPAATATEVWENSGVPLSTFSADAVMSADDMVDAALRGLDQGEDVTMPSVAEQELIEQFNTARLSLFGSAQTGRVAPRLLQA